MTTARARLVRLHDGRQAYTDSASWRAECEARTILLMDYPKQREFLRVVEERRGADAVAALRDLMHDVEPSFLLGLPDKDARRAYLNRVERDRGLNARTHLETRARAIWKTTQPTEGAA